MWHSASVVQDFATLRSMVKKWARLWRVPSLAQVEITTNLHLRTCLGRCFPKLNRIELNPSLLGKKRARLNEVLCHEAAHIAAYALAPGQSRAHSPQWAVLMTAAGFTPETTIPARKCISPRRLDEIRDRVFEHYCPVCRFVQDLEASAEVSRSVFACRGFYGRRHCRVIRPDGYVAQTR